jgi:hypothetical protein
MESHRKPAAQPINRHAETIATNKEIICLIRPRCADNSRPESYGLDDLMDMVPNRSRRRSFFRRRSLKSYYITFAEALSKGKEADFP